MRWATLLISLLLLGCPGSVTKPLEFSEAHKYDPPSFAEIVGKESPIPVVAGEIVAHDGWLLSDALVDRIKAEYRETGEQLKESHGQQQTDRALAETEDREKRAALKRCQQRKAEVFALGVALGVGGCSALERAAGAIAP